MLIRKINGYVMVLCVLFISIVIMIAISGKQAYAAELTTTQSQTIESTTPAQTATITIPNIKSVTSVTVNRGSVSSHSKSGNNVIVNVSGGASTRNTTTQTPKSATGSSTSYTNSFPSTQSYSDSSGYSGTLAKSGSSFTAGYTDRTSSSSFSGSYTTYSYTYYSKGVVTGSGSSGSAPSCYTINSNGYSGCIPRTSTTQTGDTGACSTTATSCTRTKTFVASYSGSLSKSYKEYYYQQNYAGTVYKSTITYYYGYTITVGATLYDVSPPTTPTGVTVTNRTPTSVSLSWSPSTDNVGVAKYYINVNDSLCTQTTTTSGTCSGLVNNTSYRFTVKAFDAAGNSSGVSTINVATGDYNAPTMPTNLISTSKTSSSVTLSWSPSTDNVGVIKYYINVNDVLCKETTTTSGICSGLSNNTQYKFTVKAFDAAGNSSAVSTLYVTTSDTSAPTSPSGLAVSSRTPSSISLSWSAASDDVGINRYEIYMNGLECAETSSLTATCSSLQPNTAYSTYVKAFDAVGNNSTSSTISAKTSFPGPTNVKVDSVSNGKVKLSWVAPNSGVAIQKYYINVDGQLCTEVTSTSGTCTGLTNGTSYNFTIKAFDATGNASDVSAVVSATPIDQKPSTPKNLKVVTSTPRSITLSWDASTDDVGVVKYYVNADDIFCVETTTTSATCSSNLLTGVQYKFVVKAFDTKGQSSDVTSESTIYASTVLDNIPPSAPANLVMNSRTATKISVRWNAPSSTDDVVKYQINANNVACEEVSRNVNIGNCEGLLPDTWYTIKVKAHDEAGNMAFSEVLIKTNADTEDPTSPGNPRLVSRTASSITVGWDPSTDDVGVVKYYLIADGGLCKQVAGNLYQATCTGLNPLTVYKFKVKAFDDYGHWSLSNEVSISTNSDELPPSIPTNIRVMDSKSTSIKLQWDASTDNVGVAMYYINRNNGSIECGRSVYPMARCSGLSPSTTYELTVKAMDASGKSASERITVTTLADSVAPTAPSGLRTTGKTTDSVSFQWDTLTVSDDVSSDITYKLFVKLTSSTGDAAQCATSNSDIATCGGLLSGTNYTFYVVAVDEANNQSIQSNKVFETTASVPGSDIGEDDEYLEEIPDTGGEDSPFSGIAELIPLPPPTMLKNGQTVTIDASNWESCEACYEYFVEFWYNKGYGYDNNIIGTWLDFGENYWGLSGWALKMRQFDNAITGMFFGDSPLDTLQGILDLVGMIPVVGEPLDLVNGTIYAIRGDYVNAALSMGAIIPIVGGGVLALKYAGKVDNLNLNQIDNLPSAKQITINKRVGAKYEADVAAKLTEQGLTFNKDYYPVFENAKRKKVVPDYSITDADGKVTVLADAKSTTKITPGSIPYDAQAKGFLEVAVREGISEIRYYTPTGDINALAVSYVRAAQLQGITITVFKM